MQKNMHLPFICRIMWIEDAKYLRILLVSLRSAKINRDNSFRAMTNSFADELIIFIEKIGLREDLRD